MWWLGAYTQHRQPAGRLQQVQHAQGAVPDVAFELVGDFF
jgi:hypothetical protein